MLITTRKRFERKEAMKKTGGTKPFKDTPKVGDEDRNARMILVNHE